MNISSGGRRGKKGEIGFYNPSDPGVTNKRRNLLHLHRTERPSSGGAYLKDIDTWAVGFHGIEMRCWFRFLLAFAEHDEPELEENLFEPGIVYVPGRCKR